MEIGIYKFTRGDVIIHINAISSESAREKLAKVVSHPNTFEWTGWERK